MKYFIHGKVLHFLFASLTIPPLVVKAMKIAFSLMFVLSVGVYAAGNAQQITLDIKNSSLKDVFKEIKQKSGYHFLYSEEMIKTIHVANLQVADTEIDKVMEMLSDRHQFDYQIRGKNITITRAKNPNRSDPLSGKAKKAMQRTISGKITDPNNQPLEGVSVAVKGLNLGTTSNDVGEFTLTINNQPGQLTLVFSMIGYKTREVDITSSFVNVILEEEATTLEDVVVVGYTSVKRSSLTSSVVTLQSEALTENVTHDLGSMLQGKAAGLMVTNSSGAPGSSAQMRIRGVGTITAGQSPLIVVDGIPGGTYDPNDVENVTILKDVGSTAIYGADGANGVIVITTKHGRRNQAPEINFRTNIATTNALFGRFKPMDGAELYDLWATWGIPNFESNYPQSLRQQNYDWLNNTFKQGHAQQYYASVSGGTENISYMASVNHFNQKGTMPGTSYRRSNIRMNFDVRLAPTFDMSIRMNMRENKTDNLWSYTFSEMAYRGIPWDNPFNADGSPVDISGTPVADKTWYYANRQNPWHGMQYNYDRAGGTDMNLDIVFNWQILPWLTATNTTRLGRSQGWSKVYYDARDASQTWNGITQGSRVQDNATYPLGSYGNTTLLKTDHRLGAHHLAGLLGYVFDESQGSYSFGATGEQQPTGIDVVSAGAASSMRATGGYATPSAGWSAFAQMNYSFAEKYLATVSFRADANTRFAPGRRVGYFPAASAGWLISNEDFLAGNDVLTFLKLRGSYGLTGNSSIGDFVYLDAFSFSGVTYLGAPGAQPTRLANNNLGWESAIMASAGIDFRFFTWLDGSIDVYKNRNKDLLFAAPVAPSTGFYSYTRNIGEVSNKGIEFALNTINVNKHNWKWTTSFNIGFNKNTVEKLPSDEPGKPGTPIMVGSADAARQRMEEGKELYGWYMQEWRGVDPDNGDPLWTAEDGGVTNDYVNAKVDWLGSSPNPKFSGGLQNTVSFKGFSLGANIFFLYGNTIYNGARSSMDNDGRQAQYNQISLDNDLGWSRWQAPGDVATHPLPVYGGNKNSSAASSRFLEDGSFLRLRNVNIGYDFSRTLLRDLGVKNARVFLSGDNLLTLSKFSGADPETNLSSSGINSVAGSVDWIYPVNRTFSFGIELKF